MSELICSSRIGRVAVYARGAEIIREISLPQELPGGPLDIVIHDITALADGGSFRAFLQGSRQIVGVKSQLMLPNQTNNKGPLTEKLRLLDVDRNQLLQERSSLHLRRQELSNISFRQPLSGLRNKRNTSALLQDMARGNQLIQEKLAAIDSNVSLLEEKLLEIEKVRAALLVEIQQAKPASLSGETVATRSASIRLQGAGHVSSLSLVYTVSAARWWPAYTARLSANATKANISVEAFVAQATGEDWSNVALSLCTADLILDARLPELLSLRLGRIQPKSKRGFREPPQGLDELFRSYDQSLGMSQPTTREEATRNKARPVNKPVSGESEDDASELFSLALASREKTIVPERAADLPTDMFYERAKKSKEPAAPLTLHSVIDGELAPQKSSGLVSGLVGGIMGGMAAAFGGKAEEGRGGGGLSRGLEEAEHDLSEAWLDFDSLQLQNNTHKRGKLIRVQEPIFSSQASQEIESLSPPYLTRDPKENRGHFDHRYEAQGKCEIIANGKAQRIHLLTADAPSTPVLKSVPREVSDVYREASVKNPFDAPLLSGPVDIFIDGALLTTTTLSAVDRGGYLSLGLGVEERIRIARNARVEETSTGLLSGKTHIDHHISIELTSSLGYPTRIEIIDRIPVSDDKSAEVVLSHAVPASQWYDQADKGKPIRGGLLWALDIPSEGKAKIEFSYRINFPAKNEVVGGNRRES